MAAVALTPREPCNAPTPASARPCGLGCKCVKYAGHDIGLLGTPHRAACGAQWRTTTTEHSRQPRKGLRTRVYVYNPQEDNMEDNGTPQSNRKPAPKKASKKAAPKVAKKAAAPTVAAPFTREEAAKLMMLPASFEQGGTTYNVRSDVARKAFAAGRRVVCYTTEEHKTSKRFLVWTVRYDGEGKPHFTANANVASAEAAENNALKRANQFAEVGGSKVVKL